ncbi:YfiR family protein [Pseudomonas sp. S75]|uniref:YfiR family protein n=1 Tax=unclassified Pseudomonas TaxID=196821 RepID=UPI0019070AF4|nr:MULTISPECIES: YfiR family protein [unclassified Pseudomonas]MBJ9978401.1 YfiR family protein [Pseudomonas sp. S30]MBK0156357.1 YfiR family protein [Pseudomonas sp. S75]
MSVVVSSGWRRARSALSLAIVVLSLSAAAARADTAATAETVQQRARAVAQVVMGIFSYARWPVEPSPLRLCLIGPTEYADELIRDEGQGATPAVQVRRLLAGDPLVASACDAVYIGRLDHGQRDRLSQALLGQPILSISEAQDPCTVGSLFCLHVEGDQVGFMVNLDSVARSGLRIHPSVLQLSRRRGPQP